MKFFIAFALIAAVASAAYIKPTLLTAEQAEIAEIVAAIQSPSTDPATAVALEALLLESLGINPTPIAVGPAIVESNPISVGPAIIDFPLPDGGVVTADEPLAVIPAPVVVPSPVVIGEIPSGASPLVQIIVNVNQASTAESTPVAVGPAVVDQVAEEVYVPGPVNVVDHVIAPGPVVSPIQVVEPVVPGPVNVVDHVVVEPIQVVEPIVPGPVNVVDHVVVQPIQVVEPIVVEPVIVGAPIIPAPAVVLPEDLN